MPVNVASPEQVELTREVLALKSYADTESRIGNLTSAQWTAQIADNNLWATKRDKFVELRGGKSGVFIDPQSSLGRIRNRSRLRFGLPALQGEAADADAESADGGGLISSLGWF